MPFNLTTIAILTTAAVLYAAILPARWREWALFGGSVIAIYWLQPFLTIRFASFIFPTLTLMLTAAVWFFTRPTDQRNRFPGADRVTLGVAVILVLLLALFRYLPPDYRLLVSARPPKVVWVVGLLVIGLLVIGIMWQITKKIEQRKVVAGWMVFLIVLFVVLKTEFLATAVSELWRTVSNQNPALATPLDLNWLGFSYVAFRLIHTLRDRQTGQLPDLPLREFITYTIFFPAFIAGPIDRAERFHGDWQALPQLAGLDPGRFTDGFKRISIGLLKKFVIADSLALLALTPTNAVQADSAVGLWLLLYGYAFRLFFDFAGYSDIAIGLAILFGIRLPENFDYPYLKTNITQFWQSWHITLSNWARFYVFSPLSRNLLRRKPRPSPVLIVLICQLATMITIGLWHGVTLPFLMWGIWHGLALFVHKQWSDRTRKWYRQLKERPWSFRAWTALSWFLTFHYVVLGWVWFVLPELGMAVQVFGKLFGFG